MRDSKNEQQRDERVRRLSVSIPVRIICKESNGDEWSEISTTFDLSSNGAKILSDNTLEIGRVIKLVMPMPQKLRNYDLLENQYNVWAIVSSVANSVVVKKKFSYGVAFIGRNPPPDYVKNPSLRYEIYKGSDRQTTRYEPSSGNLSLGGIRLRVLADEEEGKNDLVERRHSRLAVPVSVVLNVISGSEIESVETTVMENVSRGGASIFSSLNLDVGSRVVVNSDQYNVVLNAVVRAKRLGDDGLPRIHVEFTNGHFPLEGVES
ncbi:MAG: PilZ domain-containing protein [Pyrinomonadaceae bacterium]